MKISLWSLWGALLLASTAAQAEDSWESLGIVCEDLNIPKLDEFETMARDWEAKEKITGKDLDNLANNLCPAFLQNPNAMGSVDAAPAKGVVTLQQFVAEQTRTFTGLLGAEARGKGAQAFLVANFKDLAALSPMAQANFSETLCGRMIAERAAFIASELAALTRKTADMKKTCPQLAGNAAAQVLSQNSLPARHPAGQGAPAQPAGRAANPGESSITGTINAKQNQ